MSDGSAPTPQETIELRSKLKQAAHDDGGALLSLSLTHTLARDVALSNCWTQAGGQNPAELFRKFDATSSGSLQLSEFMLAVRKGGNVNKVITTWKIIIRSFEFFISTSTSTRLLNKSAGI